MTDTQNMRQRFIEDFAARHGLGTEAAEVLLRAVAAGGGTMAQFSHPELGGMGQWSRGGMIMVGDMFNQGLKYRVDTLCTEISDALYQNPALGAEPRATGSGGFSGGAWWPEEFGSPSSSGAQNDLRYAFFPGARRLVIDKAGAQAVYDTGEHMISGVSQQQGGDQLLSFSSQFGTVSLSNLPRIDTGWRSGEPQQGAHTHGTVAASPAPAPEPAPADKPAPAQEREPVYQAEPAPAREAVPASSPAPGSRADDIFATLERLADLKAKGILSDEEFIAKKTELLARL
ncbi:SHOCT domain-containing protein [Ancylobacter sp. A5.8]|uniref:SHOCT domain-containing protein n=1 Tax=Ancylobacter gelatini TaxID=2919920 RepID=UPI001F4D7F43|nr:SHOCT domain-containing protein [Ancylobacter gelatini]MCJ8142403.1 SHOCT domain-containing protein [Ancylobacter gelatini]